MKRKPCRLGVTTPAMLAMLAMLGCPASPDPSMQSTASTDASSDATASASDVGTTADPTDASGTTPTGDDTGPDCETCGGAACIDVMTDPAHCGGCELPCPAGIACDQGTCACPDGTMRCGDACVDVQADGMHCGGCEQPCDPGLVCLDGTCSNGCGALTECTGGCVDTDANAQHCGGCDQPCPMGAACEASECACPGPSVSYAADIEPLFVADCTSMGCHGGVMPQEQLDLREGTGYDELIDVAAAQCDDRVLVVPGDPQASYVLDKLLGVDQCMGTRMPKGADPYPPEQIDLVTAWICQGAPP
jgi:hypothetical protein